MGVEDDGPPPADDAQAAFADGDMAVSAIDGTAYAAAATALPSCQPPAFTMAYYRGGNVDMRPPDEVGGRLHYKVGRLRNLPIVIGYCPGMSGNDLGAMSAIFVHVWWCSTSSLLFNTCEI